MTWPIKILVATVQLKRSKARFSTEGSSRHLIGRDGIVKTTSGRSISVRSSQPIGTAPMGFSGMLVGGILDD